MKKILSAFIILTLIFSMCTVNANTTQVQFTDVDKSTSQGQAIYKMVESGILSGYPDSSFRPNNPLTRAELCKIINLTFNFTEADAVNFPDVSTSDWFYSYVLIAKKAGYIKGHDDGTFRGNDYLTKEEACVVICRVAGLYDIPFTGTISDEVSDWAVPYVNKVLGNRLMSLNSDNTFGATKNITRGELSHSVSPFVKSTGTTPGTSTGTSTGGGGGGSTGGGGGVGSVGGGGNTGTILPIIPPSTGDNTGSGDNTGTGDNTGSGDSTGSGDNTGSGGNTGSGDNTGSGGNTGTGGNTGSGTTQPDDDEDEKPTEPTIDKAKQDEALENINTIKKAITRFGGRFGAKAQQVLNIIYATLTETENDAKNGIAIYTKNYVVNTYGTEITEAKNIYNGKGGYNNGTFVEGMTSGEQGQFVSDLERYMPSYAADELSLMLFGKTVEQLVKDMN